MGSGSPAAHPGRSLSPGKPLPLLPAEVRGPRALGRLCSPALKSPRGVRRSSPVGSPLGSAAPQPEGDGGGVGGGVGGGLGLLYFPRHPALRRVTAPGRCSLNNQSTTRRRPALCRGMRALCHPLEIHPRPSRAALGTGCRICHKRILLFFFFLNQALSVEPPSAMPSAPAQTGSRGHSETTRTTRVPEPGGRDGG